MLQYSLSQFLIRIKYTTTILYIEEKVRMTTNPIHIFLNECLCSINAIFGVFR